MPFGPRQSNPVHLSPDLGTLAADFNRGILANPGHGAQTRRRQGIDSGHEGSFALAKAYAAHVLDAYDQYAWRYRLAQTENAAWTSLKPDDSSQDAYFDGSNQVKSAEPAFWRGSSSTRYRPRPMAPFRAGIRPHLQKLTGGPGSAAGPHSGAPKKADEKSRRRLLFKKSRSRFASAP
jgi:hypothetical protein